MIIYCIASFFCSSRNFSDQNKVASSILFRLKHSSVSLKIRGIYNIKDQIITFTTIPYRTYRNKIKEQLEKNVDVFNDLLDDFNDESSLGQNKLVFTVKKGVNPESVVLKLFALTDLQTTLSYNMNYIVNGTPKMCSILDLIKSYVNHQIDILIISTEYDKDKAVKRKHILEGLILIINSIDKAINLIKNSSNTAEAKEKLIKEFNIDEIQAKAVLDMKLARLTKLDKDDLIKELEEKKAIIAECDKILNEESYRNEKIINKVTWLRDKYGDERRTQLLNIEVPKEEKEIAEVIPEDVVVVATKSGLIKKVPAASFKVQKRGGKGVKSLDDAILDVIKTNTIDTLMFFTTKGKMYRTIVDNIPNGTNLTKGIPIDSLIKLDQGEEVIAITSLHRKTTPQYIIFTTKNGLIKKSYLSEYIKTNRNTGIAALTVKEDDKVVDIIFQDEEEIILITKKGKSIRFTTKDINPVGRIAQGVKGIKLDEDDEVIASLPIHKITDQVAIFTEGGLGKKVSLSEFPLQGRGGKGTIIYKPTIQTGDVIGTAMISDEDSILICGNKNSICFSAQEVPLLGKMAEGNIMIKNNKVLSSTKI